MVSWLSGDAGAEHPSIAAVPVTRFDPSRATFVDEPHRAGVAAADSEWDQLTGSLCASFGCAQGASDPRALADDIRQALHAAEGTGIGCLSDRLVDLHADISGLAQPGRFAAIGRFVALID